MSSRKDQTNDIEVTPILEEARQRLGGRVERIVVVEDDEEARAHIDATCHDGVILPVPRGRWSPDGGPLRDVIDWAVKAGCTSRILLVDVTARRDETETGPEHVLDRSRAAARQRRERREALARLGTQLHVEGGAAERLLAAGVDLAILMQHAEAGCVSAFEPTTGALEVVAAAGA